MELFVKSSVPIPNLPSMNKSDVTVATPTVISAISTSAVSVSDDAVVAVPVTLPVTSPMRLPVTSPVIPPIKLDAATAFAVKIPTTIFGTPLKLNAVDAVPVRLPVNPLVAVTNPA